MEPARQPVFEGPTAPEGCAPVAGFEGLETLLDPLTALADRLGDLDDSPLSAFGDGRLEAALRSGASDRLAIHSDALAQALVQWLESETPNATPGIAAIDAASANPALALPWIGATVRHALSLLDLRRLRPAAWPLVDRWAEWSAGQGPWRPSGLRWAQLDAARRIETGTETWPTSLFVWCGRPDVAFDLLQRARARTEVREAWQRTLLALVGWGWERQVLALIEGTEIESYEEVGGALGACADAGLAEAVVRWFHDRSPLELGQAGATLARCAAQAPEATAELLRKTLDKAPLLVADLSSPLLTCLAARELGSEHRSWLIDLLVGRLFAQGELLADRRFVGAVLEHEPERVDSLMEQLVRYPFPQRAGNTIARLLQRLPGFASRVLRHLKTCCETLADALQAHRALRQIERLGEPLELGPWIDDLAEKAPPDPGQWNDALWQLAQALRGEDHRRVLAVRWRNPGEIRRDVVRLHRRLLQTLQQSFRRCVDERAIDLAIDDVCRAFRALEPPLLELLIPVIERHGILSPALRDFLSGATGELSLPGPTSPRPVGPLDPLAVHRRLLNRSSAGGLRHEIAQEHAALWQRLADERDRPLPLSPVLASRSLRPGRSEVWTRYCGPSLSQVAQALGAGSAPVESWLRRIAFERPPDLETLAEGADCLVGCFREIQTALGARGFDPGLPGPDELAVEWIRDEYWQHCRATGLTINTLPYDPDQFSFSPFDLADPRWRPTVRILDPASLRRRIGPAP